MMQKMTILEKPPMLTPAPITYAQSQLKVWEGGTMSERDMVWQERRLDEILYSNTDPTAKVQQIVRLGFDEEVASELVERHQRGTQAPVYYETLGFDAEYEESLSEQRRHQDIPGD